MINFVEKFRNISRHFENYGFPLPLQTLLMIALLQGVIYTLVVPPWWHYDEPTQFEYAWLIANKSNWFQNPVPDLEMRQKLSASLKKYQYYDLYVYQPKTGDVSPYIGASQYDSDPPLYYWIVSLALRLVKHSSFAFQNYVGRSLSIVMFLGTVFLTWHIMGELSREGHFSQWVITCFVAMLPGLTDTMTSINNDVGAVLIFSLFCWIGILCLKRGLSVNRIALLLLTLVCAYYTKNTTYPIFVLALLVILFSLFYNKPKWIPFSLLAGITLIAVVFMIHWGDPADWYRLTSQGQPARRKTEKAIFGQYAFKIDKGPINYIGQFISPEEIRPLRNTDITFGAWAWADSDIEVQIPRFEYVGKEGRVYSDSYAALLSTHPIFLHTSINVPSDAIKGWINLYGSDGGVVFYDGITLAPGTFANGEPVYKEESLKMGIWNGVNFENRARNPSAEQGWFWLNSDARRLFAKISSMLSSSQIFVSAIQDRDGAGWYFRASVRSLFESFWGNPARAKVYFLGGNLTYTLLWWITLTGLLGLIVFVARRVKKIRWDITLFVFLSALFVWGVTFMRGGSAELLTLGLVPWARYAFPAIIPTAIILCVGWYEILSWISRWTNSSEEQIKYIFFSFMFALDLLNLTSILDYFYLQAGQAYVILFILIVISFGVIAWKMAPKKVNL